ncbi:MAG: PilZ domain-containing protein [Gemmataceae bacterium]
MFNWIVRFWQGLFGWGRPADQARSINHYESPRSTVERYEPRSRGLADLEASCHPIASTRDDPWPAQVRDISASNIGLQLKRRFEPGTLLAVELQSMSHSFSRTLVARVIHAKAQGGGDWIIGCILASRLDEDELQSLRV